MIQNKVQNMTADIIPGNARIIAERTTLTCCTRMAIRSGRIARNARKAVNELSIKLMTPTTTTKKSNRSQQTQQQQQQQQRKRQNKDLLSEKGKNYDNHLSKNNVD